MVKRSREIALSLTTAAVVAAVFSHAPVPQDPAYHHFLDERKVLGIPNGWNVLSNLPFLAVGALGLLAWKKTAAPKLGWLLFFAGIALTAFGSSWYHLAPSNDTLLWDRLPMTLGFTALFAAIIGERISDAAYKILFGPLVILGIVSVFYWYAGERHGAGDLRLYVLVQFFPLLMIPLILAMYPTKYTHSHYILMALVAYVVAKAAEVYDGLVGELTGGVLYGHALKHVIAAGACFTLYLMYSRRRTLA